jgi:hypothetical protein
VFRGVPLLKIGVIMMALALALVIAAVVVGATLGSEPERVAPAEVAKRSPGEAPRTSSSEVVSVTKNSSGETKASQYPSREKESPGYWSPSSGEEPVVQRKEETKELQAKLQQDEAQFPEISVRNASTGEPANIS